MRIAPLRLRLLAGFLDVVVFVTGIVAVIGAPIAVAFVYTRIRGDRGEADDDERTGEDDGVEDGPEGAEDDVPHDVRHATQVLRRSQRLNTAMKGAAAGVAISGRNWRSPGFRLVGLRRVDVHTGGRVGVRSVIAGMVFDEVWQATWRLPFSSRVRRGFVGMDALKPKLSEIEREYRGDPEGRARAMAELSYSIPGISAGGCGWAIAGPVASRLALALSSHEGRTIRDRMTGTGVIVDR